MTIDLTTRYTAHTAAAPMTHRHPEAALTIRDPTYQSQIELDPRVRTRPPRDMRSFAGASIRLGEESIGYGPGRGDARRERGGGCRCGDGLDRLRRRVLRPLRLGGRELRAQCVLARLL